MWVRSVSLLTTLLDIAHCFHLIELRRYGVSHYWLHCCVWLEVGGHEEALLGDGRVEVRSVLTIVANTTLYTWGGHVEALDDGRSHD